MAEKQISFKIDEDLHARIKIKAIRARKQIRELVAQFIKEGLERKRVNE